jgi:predicted RNA-binding protein with PUA-like domain
MARRDERTWLLKTEPEVYSIDDLARDRKTHWDGVRNYQARNFMRDQMRVGDRILIYHSNTEPPGVAGTARVCREAYPDFTAWDPMHEHYDPKSTSDNPVWLMVDVEFEEKFSHFVAIDELRARPGLKEMLVLKRAMRLSVQPVEPGQFEIIRRMGRRRAAGR